MPQNLRFQGQYLDRESGLHYYLFRYYDPVAGRYTQIDPIGLAGGLNTYSYEGDPLVWVDPLGLVACYKPPHKNVFYRTKSKEYFAVLQKTGQIPGTTETTTSPAREFSEDYDGILVQSNLKPGTRAQLEGIGIINKSDLAAVTHHDMPGPVKSKGWGLKIARFKGKNDQINIGLGREESLL